MRFVGCEDGSCLRVEEVSGLRVAGASCGIYLVGTASVVRVLGCVLRVRPDCEDAMTVPLLSRCFFTKWRGSVSPATAPTLTLQALIAADSVSSLSRKHHGKQLGI
jgi:hypothetical protein